MKGRDFTLKGLKACFRSKSGEATKFCCCHERSVAQASLKRNGAHSGVRCGPVKRYYSSTPLKTSCKRTPEGSSLARRTTDILQWLALALALPFATVLTLQGSPEGERVWFRFNKAFINANYTSGEALGTARAQTWDAAGTVYPTKCGGSDGELHIGAKDAGLDLPSSQMPLSGKALGADAEWGIVFELPDAKAGKGPATLAKHADKTVTFKGYFRVWNEGHWKGQCIRAIRITSSKYILPGASLFRAARLMSRR
jgi:hypothetical protein